VESYEVKRVAAKLMITGSSLDFFDKEYILISRRYQIHSASATTLCPSGNMDTHNQKKKNYRKEKTRYSDKFLVTAALTPSRQH
jgi:hypothetical protein